MTSTNAPTWVTGSRNAGRKATKGKTTEPLDLEGAPPRGWRRFEWFCQEFVKVPSGKGARKPLVLREWQLDIARGVLPEACTSQLVNGGQPCESQLSDGRPVESQLSTGERPRQALVELARGQGKSTLAVALCLYLAFADDEESPEVILVASNERQAERLLRRAWRICQLDARLEARAELYKADRRLDIGFNGGSFLALPSRFDALQGYEPSVVVLDEAHVVEQEVYDALVTSLGKRAESCLLTISTPGDSQESLLWRLHEHARAGTDGSFWFTTFAAPDGCDVWDRDAWHHANPALGDFLHLSGLESAARSMLPHRENMFRRLHLCQWAGSEDAWIPYGAWPELESDEQVAPGTAVVLGFDGSWSRDATALVGCTVTRDRDPHVFVLGLWEWDAPGWRVPLEEVNATIAHAFATYDVKELAVDKNHWRGEVDRWRAEYGAERVLDITQTGSVFAPMLDRTYQAILEGALTHDGHEGLARHVANAVAVEKSGQVHIYKPKNAPSKDSAEGRIDAAVAMVMAHNRAAWHAENEPPPPVQPFVILV